MEIVRLSKLSFWVLINWEKGIRRVKSGHKYSYFFHHQYSKDLILCLLQERIREDIAEAEIKVYPSSLLPEDEDVLQANAPIRKHLPLAVVGGYFLHRPFHIDLPIYKVVGRYSIDSYFTQNIACVFLIFAL